jgi:hypothetical protein
LALAKKVAVNGASPVASGMYIETANEHAWLGRPVVVVVVLLWPVVVVVVSDVDVWEVIVVDVEV